MSHILILGADIESTLIGADKQSRAECLMLTDFFNVGDRANMETNLAACETAFDALRDAAVAYRGACDEIDGYLPE